MLLSIWRYSHLTWAISSFLFLLTASITGIILTFDPILEEVNTYSLPKASVQTIQQTLHVLKDHYQEVIEIKVNNNHLVQVSGIDNSGNATTAYIHPITGKSIAGIPEQKNIFKWVTSLHRSLFLKSTGRILVGITSFLLFLITISGTILIIKRQGSFKSFFYKVVKENFYEYYHVILSRFLCIPIVVIALTGVYLSLGKFSLLPKSTEKHQVDYEQISQETQPKNIAIFEQTLLKDIQKLEFPFSDDAEDYYVLKLVNQELYIHQYTGDILSSRKTDSWQQMYSWSFILHTGKGNFLWTLVLLASSLSLLFFMYSGFNITWQRVQKKGKRVKNKYAQKEAEYVILVGSETGSTLSFASSFYLALIQLNKKAYLCSLNEYTRFDNLQHLIVITATYGNGEPPKNAEKFFSKFNQYPITQKANFAVVGFGSTAYPYFCKYAIDVEKFLSNIPNLSVQLALKKIDKQSFNSFNQWAIDWGKTINIQPDLQETKPTTQTYKVFAKTELDANNTFMLTLKPTRKNHICSGDLIGIQPNKQEQQRLYSIAIVDKNIILSIKKHTYGLCSNYLYNLKENSVFEANFVQNKSFHFPKKATHALLIANGTGIAPFLGMISENKQKKHLELFAGFKNPDCSKMYHSILNKAQENNQLQSFYIAYSRTQKEYVQDTLLYNSASVVNTLNNNGVILICGSLKMKDGVFTVLEQITQRHMQLPLSYFNELGMIKTDCY